jgi:ATP-dependent RNA helicase SUPV3L1/SUV3
MAPMTVSGPGKSGRGVLAVLGPTNTGKTHLAIDRMVSHESGIIGLPLRLLAREVYGRVCDKVGAANVALITGEEKINANGKARFQVCTVEAMPDETDAAFVAIDEVQLAADMERGHIFTDRLMNLRGRHETMLLGAATVQRVLQELLPGISVVTRARMSMLTYAGQKKITRLPARSAIVAFSADEVYAIAELIRRQRGGAAVVLGSLSPRTRNAQVALYQSGDVDFLVATDAIGMGLNLDVDHVAFAQEHKFDGFSHRRLTPAEMGQIAGRAGRHVRNGTFGVTGQVNPFDDELVERLETHHFDPVKVLIWRNRDLDFSSIANLKASLEMPSPTRLLMKSFPAPDAVALDHLSRVEEISRLCATPAMIRLLWDVCQTPDFRKISPGEHAELLRSIFLDLASKNRIDADWFAAQVKLTDRTDGDIDALSQRIAHVRTWTYLSHRQGWMSDPVHWQERTREIEDRLSDALHESLTKRFIDRRTSVLMKRLRENAMLEAEIAAGGEVTVEGHHVGRLQGFRFTPDASATGPDAKAASGAAMKALAAEIVRRAERLAASPNSDIALGSDATLRWLGDPVGKIVSGDDMLKPRIVILADEQLTGPPRDLVSNRLDRWLSNHINTLLKPLADLGADEQLAGIARGVAFRLVENLGVIDRRDISSEIQSLDQQMRASLRRHGVRFGAYHIFVPALLKPAPAGLICMLWGMKHDRLDEPGLTGVPHMLASGRTSFPADATIDPAIYRICGYKVLGPKAVRIDILERLADLIRPALAWKPQSGGKAPEGAVDGRAFTVAPSMLSILGATHEDMEAVLKGLGYRGEPRKETEVAAMRERAAALAAPATVAEAPPAEAAPAEDATAPADSEAAPVEAAETVEAAGAAAGTEEVSTEPASEPLAEPALETAAVEASPETAHGTTQAPQDEEAPAAAEVVEEKMVLLWRPGRPDRPERQRQHNRTGNQPNNRHDNNRQREAAPGGEAPAGQPQQPGGRNGQRRDGQHRDGQPRHERSGEQRFDKRGGERHGKRNEGGNGYKGGKPGDNRRDNNKPFNAPPRQPERPVDPDSPFAKLLALKAQMEKGNG